MSKNEKSTPKAKVLTAVLLIVFLGSCAVLVFAVCTDILGIAPKNPNPTEPQATTAVSVTESATVETTEASEASASASAPQSSTAVFSQLTLGSTYNVDYWVENKAEHGTPGLALLYGTKVQSVYVSFDNDRFSVNVVKYNESQETETGTYSFTDNGNIELRYDNSNITTATVLESENGMITTMDFPLWFKDTTLRLSLED